MALPLEIAAGTVSTLIAFWEGLGVAAEIAPIAATLTASASEVAGISTELAEVTATASEAAGAAGEAVGAAGEAAGAAGEAAGAAGEAGAAAGASLGVGTTITFNTADVAEAVGEVKHAFDFADIITNNPALNADKDIAGILKTAPTDEQLDIMKDLIDLDKRGLSGNDALIALDAALEYRTGAENQYGRQSVVNNATNVIGGQDDSIMQAAVDAYHSGQNTESSVDALARGSFVQSTPAEQLQPNPLPPAVPYTPNMDQSINATGAPSAVKPNTSSGWTVVSAPTSASALPTAPPSAPATATGTSLSAATANAVTNPSSTSILGAFESAASTLFNSISAAVVPLVAQTIASSKPPTPAPPPVIPPAATTVASLFQTPSAAAATPPTPTATPLPAQTPAAAAVATAQTSQAISSILSSQSKPAAPPPLAPAPPPTSTQPNPPPPSKKPGVPSNLPPPSTADMLIGTEIAQTEVLNVPERGSKKRAYLDEVETGEPSSSNKSTRPLFPPVQGPHAQAYQTTLSGSPSSIGKILKGNVITQPNGVSKFAPETELRDLLVAKIIHHHRRDLGFIHGNDDDHMGESTKNQVNAMTRGDLVRSLLR